MNGIRKQWCVGKIFPTALLLCFVSCVHREFDYDRGRSYLDVVFDWINEPGAQPGSMSLYLYRTEDSGPQRFDFEGRDGGTICILPGLYDAICLNNDIREIAFRGGDSHGTFEVTTPEVRSLQFGTAMEVRSMELPRAEGTETQPIVSQPPVIWAASGTGHRVHVTPEGVRSGNQELRMFPERIVDTYMVTVRNIRNVGALSAMSATVSDMADGYAVGGGHPCAAPVTLPVDLDIRASEEQAEGYFLTFGHCPETDRTHYMMLYAILKDDTKYYYKFDVTGQVHSQPDSKGIYHIIIDGIDIPDPGGDEPGVGGLDPTVTEWDAENISLKL